MAGGGRRIACCARARPKIKLVMLSELGRLTAQMRAASGARAERQLADGRALEAHQRHVKEEKKRARQASFHWLKINLLWQLIHGQ